MKQFRLFTLLAAALLSAPLWAQGPWTSGDCTVTLADGVLTVSGDGAMGNRTTTGDWGASAIKTTVISIVVEEGVTVLGENAFNGCANATSVSLPSTLTSIELSAFKGCSNLPSVTIPAAVTRIRQQAFQSCSKLQLVRFLPTTPPEFNGVRSDLTFDGCHASLRLEYPDGSDDAYASDPVLCPNWWDRLYNATTGEHAPYPSASGTSGSINWALSNGRLEISADVVTDMPSNYGSTSTPWYPFKEYITEVVIGSNVTSVGKNSFYDHTNITSVTLSETVAKIYQNAFYQCSALPTISIPSSVNFIDKDAFRKCTAMTELYLYSDPTLWEFAWDENNCNDFMGAAQSRTTKCYVPAEHLATYESRYNKGESTDINVTFAVALEDNNASVETDLENLESYGETVHTLKITRTLYKDGAFNTLCLPFALASLTGTPLEGAEVFEFVSAEKVDAALHINIRPVDAIEAGKPYLIRWASGENITSMVFSNVQVTAHEGSEVKPEGDVAFIGTLDVTDLPENENYLFVGANNTLYYSDGTADMKAFRAYFRVDAAGGGGSMAPARFNILPKLPTGTDNVRTGSIQVEKVMENGVLYIIKNGVRYNAQGRIVE
ncbi:MAG: leucine-rich repeat domain-containing protein [Paludibacteraceae bacterium]|nr:leucine-rich repeat domain-containing protein [Paludibacteraceae bacterium]